MSEIRRENLETQEEVQEQPIPEMVPKLEIKEKDKGTRRKPGVRQEKQSLIDATEETSEQREKRERKEKLIDTVLSRAGIFTHVYIDKADRSGGYSTFGTNNLTEVKKKGSNFLGHNVIGMSDLGDIEKQILPSPEYSRDAIDRIGEKMNFKEFIDVRARTKEVFEYINIPEKKGFLGIGHKPASVIKKDTGKKELVPFDEVVEDGSKETAFDFTYHIIDVDSTVGHVSYWGVVILPKPTAIEFAKALYDDPTIMRDVFDAALVEKILMEEWGLSQKRELGKYRSKICPSWRRWDEKSGGIPRIYIQKQGDTPGHGEDHIYPKTKIK